VRDIYLTERVGEAKTLLKEVGCQGDDVAEIPSHTTGRCSEVSLDDTVDQVCRSRSGEVNSPPRGTPGAPDSQPSHSSRVDP
jgi:hypothetical protein